MLSGKIYKTNVAKIYLPPLKTPNIRGTPEPLKKLLQPVDLSESDDDNDNEFTKFLHKIKSDYREMNVLRNQQYEQRKINKDMMDGFTENHKAALVKVRSETQMENFDGCPDLTEAISICNSKCKALQVKKIDEKKTGEKKLNALKCFDFLNDDYESAETNDSTEISYNYMSGFWRILETDCVKKGIKITPRNYNAYEQVERNLLEYPRIEPALMETYKQKCAEWLRNQF